MSMGKQIYYHHLRERIRKMHPRFKQLAVEAGAYEDGDTVLVGPMDTARFAELIVRECLTVINQSNGVGDDDVIRISRDVKQHFGVEL